jgi:ribose 5-phosphate isomerase B
MLEVNTSAKGISMHIALASDHAGFDYKQRLQLFLIESGHIVEDFGPASDEPVDYPLFIRPAAEAVAAGDFDRGIIFGGSGNGEAIVANRVPGIRCVLCWNVESARLGREHNDANMLSIGQRMVDFEDVLAMVEVWLETPFAGGRHLRRIRLIDRPQKESQAENGHVIVPHRTNLVEEGRYICDSCREEFTFPIDISAGETQKIVEQCPVCCHENTVSLTINEAGKLSVRGDLHMNG